MNPMSSGNGLAWAPGSPSDGSRLAWGGSLDFDGGLHAKRRWPLDGGDFREIAKTTLRMAGSGDGQGSADRRVSNRRMTAVHDVQQRLPTAAPSCRARGTENRIGT